MAADPSFRARWLQALALGDAVGIEAIKSRLDVRLDAFEVLREPQVGLVMVKARAGGSGSPFHLGEATVTRSAVRSADGTVGIGWVQGRRLQRSLDIACLDAVFQTTAPARVAALVAELEAALSAGRATVARKAAATKVEFFTLVRGED
jgi:alpha-D-ribose 1-methylphosphonate 5-triphosphate synthase subunit PhnG